MFFTYLSILGFLLITNFIGFNYSSLNLSNSLFKALTPISRVIGGTTLFHLLLDASVFSIVIANAYMKKKWLATVVFLLLLNLIPWIIEFVNIDSCLDRGSKWNYLSEVCIDEDN